MSVAHPHQRCAPVSTVWATLRNPNASNALEAVGVRLAAIFGVDAGALNPIACPSSVEFHNVRQPRSTMNSVAPTLSGTLDAVWPLWYGIHPYQ